MEKRTVGEIVQMELSRQEKEHRSGSRCGFHVYLSRFFREFKVLSPMEKREMLGINIILGEDESVDSLQIQETTKFQWAMSCRVQAGFGQWSFLSQLRKCGEQELHGSMQGLFLVSFHKHRMMLIMMSFCILSMLNGKCLLKI